MCTLHSFTHQNMPESLIDQVGGGVYTFGSYRLGVNTKGEHCWSELILTLTTAILPLLSS